MAGALRGLSKVPRGDLKVQNNRSSLMHLRPGLGNSRRFNQGSFGHRRLKISCDANPDPAEAFVHVATTITATGVPLLEELMQLSAPDATTRALYLISRALIAASLGGLVVGAVHARLCSFERQRTDFQPFISTVVSCTKPAMVLLPYYCICRIATILSALVEVAATKMRPEFDILTRGNSDNVLYLVKVVTQFLQDTSELVAITFLAWSFARLKDRLIQALKMRILRESDNDGETSSLARFLEGVSSVLSWVIWLTAAVVAITSYGVNLRPLLTSLGASSIVLGIAAQSILSNVVSGIALYTSPAFIVGDEVTLVTVNGAVVVDGVVRIIAPTRTIIRSDDGAMVYINNADLGKMLVKNKSQRVALMP